MKGSFNMGVSIRILTHEWIHNDEVLYTLLYAMTVVCHIVQGGVIALSIYPSSRLRAVSFWSLQCADCILRYNVTLLQNLLTTVYAASRGSLGFNYLPAWRGSRSWWRRLHIVLPLPSHARAHASILCENAVEYAVFILVYCLRWTAVIFHTKSSCMYCRFIIDWNSINILERTITKRAIHLWEN